MAIKLKNIFTMTELRTNLVEIVNEVHNLNNKKVVTVNGKPAIQIQDALKAEDIEKEIDELRKENDILKTLLGIKHGVEAYLKGQFVDHEVAENRFEQYLSIRCSINNMKRKLIWTLPVLDDLEQYVKYLEKKSPNAAKQLIKNIFAKVKLLKKFPGMGRPIQQIEEAKRKAEYRLALEAIPETDLELKELVINKYVLMNGYNENAVVILFMKHQAQKDYTI